MDFLAVPAIPNRLRSASSYPAYLAPLVTCWGLTHAAEAKVVDGVCKPGDPPQGWTCGNAKPHRGQACAPAGGNRLSQPGQRVANRIPNIPLPGALALLQATTFHASKQLYQVLLDRDAARKGQ